MNIFKSASDVLGGNADNDGIKDKVENKPSNIIDKKEVFKNAIVGTLSNNMKGQTADMSDKTLVIHGVDSLFYNSINNAEFIEELALKINNEIGAVFAGISILNDNVGEESAYTKVIDNIYMEIRDEKIKQEILGKKAVFSVPNGRGSLIGGEAVIDTSNIIGLSKYNFNIGRGKQSELSDGSFRENYIALDDNVDSPGYVYNQNVSRCHAHVRYEEGKGFYLYVEAGGCQMSGNRTRIYRGGVMANDLNNIKLPFKLEDGDVIELGKAVNLLVKIVE